MRRNGEGSLDIKHGENKGDHVMAYKNASASPQHRYYPLVMSIVRGAGDGDELLLAGEGGSADKRVPETMSVQ